MTTDKPEATSLTTQGKGMPENDVPPQTIIPTGKFSAGGIVPHSIRSRLADLPLTGETIIPAEADGGAEGIMSDDAFNKSFTQLAFEAEQRRQTVQAEAMVNLAVGVVITQLLGVRNVTITQDDLTNFNRDYSVTQRKNDNGSFTIIVTPKEV